MIFMAYKVMLGPGETVETFPTRTGNAGVIVVVKTEFKYIICIIW